MSRFRKVTGGPEQMQTQRVLVALGAGIVVVFLGAGLLGVFSPGSAPAAFEAGGARLWLNLFWLAAGIGLALSVRRMWARKK